MLVIPEPIQEITVVMLVESSSPEHHLFFLVKYLPSQYIIISTLEMKKSLSFSC